jgi:signal peptide peptidase SppA
MARPDWRCGAARDLPLDGARTWDGPAATKRMLDAGGIGGNDPRPVAAKRGFLLYDAANPNLRSSYQLAFANRIDNKLTAVAAGLRAAALLLPQIDLPEREKQRAQEIIARYEQRIGDNRDKATQSRRAPLSSQQLAHRLPHLAQRFFNTPLALHPAKAEVIMAALADRLGVTAFTRANGEAVALFADDDIERSEPRGYDVIDGVAVIPICGTLVHKLGSVRPYSGMTGYDGIALNLAQALDDSDVRGVMFDIDSPGGEVCGCFDLADAIFAARGRKPIWAVLSEVAFSAAYAIASCADRIVVPRTGAVGSVGVIALIADLSGMLDKGGIKVNVIQFGARKADGLEVLPLSPEARDRFQADIDVLGRMFVDTVARNRKLDAGLVQATEAGTFLGADGVRVGLADAVAAPDDAFREFVQSLKG